MLSVFLRQSPALGLAVAKGVLALPAHKSRSAIFNAYALSRCFASKPLNIENIAVPYTAAVLEEYDQPLVLAKMTNDTPLGTDMVRVAVHYCSLNVTDVNKMSRTPDSDDGLLPQVPGCEFSGEVTEVGDYVTASLKIGDKVVALLGNIWLLNV